MTRPTGKIIAERAKNDLTETCFAPEHVGGLKALSELLFVFKY